MSAPINDGGPAFPAPMFTRQADGQPMCPQEFGLGGMSLRDWLAGQALVGMLQNYTTQKFGVGEETCARGAYEFADAMIAARERTEGNK